MGVHGSNDVVNAWKQEVLNSRGKDAEHTLKCCLDIERYAKEHKDAALLGFAYFYSGETYYLLNDVEHMFHNIAQAIHLLGQTGQWELIARSYNLMAISSVNKGNVSAAMDYYLTGLNYCRKYGITKMEISIMQNLGNLYMENGVYHEAQSYFEKAHSYCKSNPDVKENYVGLMASYVNLARCYMLQGMLDKTHVYIEKLDANAQSYTLAYCRHFVNYFVRIPVSHPARSMYPGFHEKESWVNMKSNRILPVFHPYPSKIQSSYTPHVFLFFPCKNVICAVTSKKSCRSNSSIADCSL